MTRNPPRNVWRKYFSLMDFTEKFKTEEDCERYLFEIKYSGQYKCKKCGSERFYRRKSVKFKRKRIIECAACKKLESLTANTVFHGTKLPLLKWFWAYYLIAQTKKGISGCELSRRIKVAESTAILMLNKIRKTMEEDAIKYKIGGEGKIVEFDEIEIGGKKSEKQNVLILLEKDAKTGKIGRARFAPMPDKSKKSLELFLIPQIEPGSVLHSDGKKHYGRLITRYFRKYSIKQVTHKEENYSHQFLKDINIIAGNLKTWYRGTFKHFALKNTAYYLNEFEYRFNRRRTEKNIFDRLLRRSIKRPKILKLKELYRKEPYLPLAS